MTSRISDRSQLSEGGRYQPGRENKIEAKVGNKAQQSNQVVRKSPMDAVSRYLDQEYLILQVQQLEQDLLDMKHRCETAETEVLSLREIVKLKDL